MLSVSKNIQAPPLDPQGGGQSLDVVACSTWVVFLESWNVAIRIHILSFLPTAITKLYGMMDTDDWQMKDTIKPKRSGEYVISYN